MSAWWKPLTRPAEVRKLAVVLVTVAGQALALGLLSGAAERWVTLGLGLAAIFGVYGIPNRIGIPGTYTPGAP
jgi:hypothetical protein